jgi:hypothetical protein
MKKFLNSNILLSGEEGQKAMMRIKPQKVCNQLSTTYSRSGNWWAGLPPGLNINKGVNPCFLENIWLSNAI